MGGSAKIPRGGGVDPLPPSITKQSPEVNAGLRVWDFFLMLKDFLVSHSLRRPTMQGEEANGLSSSYPKQRHCLPNCISASAWTNGTCMLCLADPF